MHLEFFGIGSADVKFCHERDFVPISMGLLNHGPRRIALHKTAVEKKHTHKKPFQH